MSATSSRPAASKQAPDDSSLIVVGAIAAPYGVRGFVHIRSFTDPWENLLALSPWYIGNTGSWRHSGFENGRIHGDGLVARLNDIEDRDSAAMLRGKLIAVPRAALPEPDAGHYYWSDLVGLEVVTTNGQSLGQVARLIETGANDVLVVAGERERLIPFVTDSIVKRVDLESCVIHVDWDPEY